MKITNYTKKNKVVDMDINIPKKSVKKVKIPNVLTKAKKSSGWFRVYPYGISASHIAIQPVMVFKDDSKDITLSVRLSPREAAESVLGNNKLLGSPHGVTQQVFESLSLEIESCYFLTVKEKVQYVQLNFKNHPLKKSMVFKAAEALSLCLHLNVPFFSNKEFIKLSKDISYKDLMDGVHIKEIMSEIGKRKHYYLM